MCVFHSTSTSKNMIFFSFFFGFFMYVERESLSVKAIYPHLPGPCMFFSPKVCVCGNVKLTSKCAYCFLLHVVVEIFHIPCT
jgi:hypothetical protein